MRNPVCRIAQSALHSTPWHTCTFRHQLDFPGKHSACCNYYAKTIHSSFCILQYASIARYSFIQLRELGVVEIANSVSLWTFIVFIGRPNLQFVGSRRFVGVLYRKPAQRESDKDASQPLPPAESWMWQTAQHQLERCELNPLQPPGGSWHHTGPNVVV